MYEKKFLLYLLYITLIELREFSHETNNKKFYWLADILHNIPLGIDSNEEEVKKLYQDLVDNVKELGIQSWLETRKSEFFSQNPEFVENSK
jgi:hypothetical protein